MIPIKYVLSKTVTKQATNALFAILLPKFAFQPIQICLLSENHKGFWTKLRNALAILDDTAINVLDNAASIKRYSGQWSVNHSLFWTTLRQSLAILDKTASIARCSGQHSVNHLLF